MTVTLTVTMRVTMLLSIIVCYHRLPKALETGHLEILDLGLPPITKARIWSLAPYKPGMVGRASYNPTDRRGQRQKNQLSSRQPSAT